MTSQSEDPQQMPKAQMTPYEQLAIRLSVAAVLVALIAPVLTVWLTYRFFDPSSKEYEERGTFAIEDVTVAKAVVDVTKGQSYATAVVKLRNLGPRPIRSPQLVVVPRDQARVGKAAFRGETSTANKTGGVTTHTLVGAVAVGAIVEVEFDGNFSSVTVRTEHGDTLPILKWHQSLNTLDIATLR